MNLFADIRMLVVDALAGLAADGVLPRGMDLSAVITEPPGDALHGEMATNAAMVLARQAGQRPRVIASALAARLLADPRVLAADVAGPGFLNLRLAPALWQAVPGAVLTEGRDFGRCQVGAGLRVDVDWTLGNRRGPLHLTQARAAVQADMIATLLEMTGHRVCRTCRIWGGRQDDDAVGAQAVAAQGPQAAEPLAAGPQAGTAQDAAALARDAMRALRVPTDHLQADIADTVMTEAVDRLAALGMVREVDGALILVPGGVAETPTGGKTGPNTGTNIGPNTGPPDGTNTGTNTGTKTGANIGPKSAGPESIGPGSAGPVSAGPTAALPEWPLRRADGGWSLLARDIGWLAGRLAQGADRIVSVLEAHRGGDVTALCAAARALSGGRALHQVRLVPRVTATRGGGPLDHDALSDVLDAVGVDLVRFHLMARRPDAALGLDLDRMTDPTHANPAFDVQYAHVRLVTALKQAAGQGIDLRDDVLAAQDLSGLTDPAELALMRRLAEWPRQIEIAARMMEPHRIVTALSALAGAVHLLWGRGQAVPGVRFLQDTPEATLPKIALVRATAVVISAGLGILRVTPMEEMR